jgi:hypothetical protein
MREKEQATRSNLMCDGIDILNSFDCDEIDVVA